MLTLKSFKMKIILSFSKKHRFCFLKKLLKTIHFHFSKRFIFISQHITHHFSQHITHHFSQHITRDFTQHITHHFSQHITRDFTQHITRDFFQDFPMRANLALYNPLCSRSKIQALPLPFSSFFKSFFHHNLNLNLNLEITNPGQTGVKTSPNPNPTR